MVWAYRIARAKYSRSSKQMLSGKGAELFGGRWSSPGRAVVYSSGSASLATLEVMVHLNNHKALHAYSIIELEIPEKLIMPLDPTSLPVGWNALVVNPSNVQNWGNVWFDTQVSTVLAVPSVVTPREFNYLINPVHPDFLRIVASKIEQYQFDPRIKLW